MWVLLAALTTTSALHTPRSVVLGLNKYSHNACVAVADAQTGELLFAQEKERLTRVKNDGGAVGDLVRHALAARHLGDALPQLGVRAHPPPQPRRRRHPVAQRVAAPADDRARDPRPRRRVRFRRV